MKMICIARPATIFDRRELEMLKRNLPKTGELFRMALWVAGILLVSVSWPGVCVAQNQEGAGDQVALLNGSPITTVEFQAALEQAMLPWATADQPALAHRCCLAVSQSATVPRKMSTQYSAPIRFASPRCPMSTTFLAANSNRVAAKR